MQASLAATAAAALIVAVGLAGCAPRSDADIARDECVKSATAKLGEGVSDIDMSAIETMNFSEALFESQGGSLPDDGQTYTVTGDFSFRTSDATHLASIFCVVTMEGGAPTEPVDAEVVDPRD